MTHAIDLLGTVFDVEALLAQAVDPGVILRGTRQNLGKGDPSTAGREQYRKDAVALRFGVCGRATMRLFA